jgi:hypothetical protein
MQQGSEMQQRICRLQYANGVSWDFLGSLMPILVSLAALPHAWRAVRGTGQPNFTSLGIVSPS